MAAHLAARILGPELRAIEGTWHRIELGSDGSEGPLLGGDDLSGALALSAAYSAINRISSDIAVLGLDLHVKDGSGGEVVAEGDPFHEITAISPDGGQTTAFDFRQTLAANVLGWGRAYARIHSLDSGLPVELEWLDPRRVRPARREGDRGLYFEVDGYQTPAGTLRADEVIWLRGLSLDHLSCLSPVRHHREVIELGLEAQGFGRTLFSQSAVPRGYLKVPKKLGPEGRRNLRASFEEAHTGRAGWNRMAVLEEGVEWVKTGIDPDDAQFLSTRKFQVEEVARIFSIPPHKIGDYSKSNYNNIEAANIDYITTTLLSWVVKFESEFNSKLLTRRERRRWRYRADMAVLARGDMEARSSYLEKLRRMGAITANQIATREGLAPVPKDAGGDLYIVPVNFTTLARVGEASAPAPTGPAGGDDDGPESEAPSDAA